MNAYEILEIYAGIAEIIALVVIMYFGREVWWRAKDYDCFGRIVTGEFVFDKKHYNDNKRALISYIHAYINYGYNIRCDMNAEEFRSNITKFMRQFSKVDNNRLKTVKLILDNISTDVRKGIKLGDESCKIRARYLMKKIEKVYSEEINSDDEDIAEFLSEIYMLLSEETW